MSLRIIGDEILLDGVTVARLLHGLRLGLRDQLTAALDAADEDYVAELEDLLERREARITALEKIIEQAPVR